MFLIYDTEEEAWNRSELEGVARGLSYHNTGKGTRFVSSPRITAEDTYALNVDGYALTEEEATSVVDSYNAPTTLEIE